MTVGAFASHGLYALIHECAHRLVFASTVANTAIAIVANLAHGVPSAVSFSRYHLSHHRSQGDYAHDADLPMRWEHDVFGTHPAGKVAWLAAYPLLMIARAARVSRMSGLPAVVPATVINLVCVFGLDALWVWRFGATALAYLLLSFYFGIGPHLLGARWVQEHFVLQGAQETNSYYGPCNRLALNVGYHNEHNDFPAVPWSRLPAVRALAPEHYDALTPVRSYAQLLARFITDRNLTLRSRVVR